MTGARPHPNPMPTDHGWAWSAPGAAGISATLAEARALIAAAAPAPEPEDAPMISRDPVTEPYSRRLYLAQQRLIDAQVRRPADLDAAIENYDAAESALDRAAKAARDLPPEDERSIMAERLADPRQTIRWDVVLAMLLIVVIVAGALLMIRAAGVLAIETLAPTGGDVERHGSVEAVMAWAEGRE